MFENIVSFNKDIKTLFKQIDIDSMKSDMVREERRIDLSNYDDVKKNSNKIYQALSNKVMPCYGNWNDEQIKLFKKWIDQGMNE
ncbi:Hypothetical protein KVN_LOCUS104 [uncultured virus]|nr:Hypothetical protein KVN_LOCUS104 [uncultured virus]